MPDFQPLIINPREDMDAEYKSWLDISTNHGRATIAKAAIGLTNYGGGFIIIGFSEEGPELVSQPRPENIPEITQDAVNAAIRRYSDPEFHIELHKVTHPNTRAEHIVISVPGGQTEPVMSKRDCDGVITQNRCYVRKPGPRTEPAQTREEWRTLLERCVQARREDMLDAIRAIVTGRVEAGTTIQNVEDIFTSFVTSARERWSELVENLPGDMPAKFPHGSYELAFSFAGADPAATLTELQDRLAEARRIKLTGWTTFLQMVTPGYAPYPHEEYVEAWVGRPITDDAAARDPSVCDFWRASLQGELYTIRGYAEDGNIGHTPGTYIDVTIPVWRVGEGLLFAERLAETFENVEQILIHCRFTGLRGRGLTSLSRNRVFFGNLVSQTEEIILFGQATPEQIRDNLAEVLTSLLAPLYERFDFFRLPEQLVGEEIQRLQQGRF